MEELARELDCLDSAVRSRSLVESMPGLRPFNMHCHTFYSYNGYGYSPTHIAALAAKLGWRSAGLVDFDVLDGVDEFLNACAALRVPAAAGMETRVYVPELADSEINSPGEPGIAYHLGMRFRSSRVPAEWKSFAADLKAKANARTRQVVEKVNTVLPEIALDFDAEAEARTPAGNVTERHICSAYREMAEKRFSGTELEEFWTGKIGEFSADAVKLEGKIRSKLMKQGGVGYIAPKPENFPTLEEMNAFVRGCGAIPTVAWLNGLSAGENDVDALLDLHQKYGAGAVTLIPDRNWRAADEAKSAKLVAELDRFVAACAARNLPLLAGTEMNAPGQLLNDDFSIPQLIKHLDVFCAGVDAFAK
ncbi:MAG: hypothetical protein IKA87_08670 [Lentisphaeria bacterium]|nr:hypothetical protein [Lentisphaeria bacterium]